jgi:phenylacetate-CoA ligase
MSFIIKNYYRYLKRSYYKNYLIQKKVRHLPLDEIKKIQWRRLKDLLNYAYENNDFYKEYLESVNLEPAMIRTPLDMSKLPLTEKKEYINNMDKIITKNVIENRDYVVATTSGSTGEPFKHYVDSKREQMCTEMSFILNMESAGIKPFEKNNELSILFHPSKEIIDFRNRPTKNLINHIIYSFFPESFGIRGYMITKENTPELVDLIKENNIKGIYGIASSILNFAQYIDDEEVLKLDYVITMGEELLDYQRQYISKIFNCLVFMDYGSSECMRMGFECKNHNGFHMDIYNYYFEFLPHDQLSTDVQNQCDLVVTNLNNYVFPFIRYKTSDGVILSDEPTTCGNNLPMVKKIFGKNIIGFTAPNGYRLSSVDFAAFFEHYHKKNPTVKQFQIIQKDDKTLLIKIVPTTVYNEKFKKDLEEKMSMLVEGSMKIEVIPVEGIAPEKSGKTKVLVLQKDAEKY